MLRTIVTYIIAILTATALTACPSKSGTSTSPVSVEAEDPDTVIVGAARFDDYMPQLAGKRVALFSNHTGMVDGRHTLDHFLEH